MFVCGVQDPPKVLYRVATHRWSTTPIQPEAKCFESVSTELSTGFMPPSAGTFQNLLEYCFILNQAPPLHAQRILPIFPGMTENDSGT